MTGKTMTRPLTDAERALAERYHNLVYRVMHDLHLGTEADTDLYLSLIHIWATLTFFEAGQHRTGTA